MSTPAQSLTSASQKSDGASSPILSERSGHVTTIWRDGDVLRTDPWGRTMQLKPIHPIPEPMPVHTPTRINAA